MGKINTSLCQRDFPIIQSKPVKEIGCASCCVFDKSSNSISNKNIKTRKIIPRPQVQLQMFRLSFSGLLMVAACTKAL